MGHSVVLQVERGERGVGEREGEGKRRERKVNKAREREIGRVVHKDVELKNE